MSSEPARVLVVAHKTAATPALLNAIRERAGHGWATFHLLVPNPVRGAWAVVDAADREKVEEAEHVLALALPLIEEAAGAPVTGSVSAVANPMDAIHEAVRADSYDEIVISTLPHGVSRWLHLDLPARVAARIGLPVTTVVAQKEASVTTR